MRAWGLDSEGQSSPPYDLAQARVIQISAGSNHSLALLDDGSLVGWGRNRYGQSPPTHPGPFAAVSAGGNHSLALAHDGTVTAFGDNTSGQTSVPSGLSGIVAISAGWVHSAAVTIVDDGLQGANVVLINEKGAAWEDELTIELYLEDRLVAKEAKKISVPARETLSMNVSEWFGRFYDVSYAYRFGPPSVDLVVAKMGAAVGTYSPFTTVRPCRADLSVRALAKRDGSIEVTSNGYLRALSVEAPGYFALRNHLDVPPGHTVHLLCVPRANAEPRPVFRPSLHAINVSSPIRVEFSEEKKEGT